VFAGATIICHDADSKPGTPASATVGTSGNAAVRVVVVTPSARSWPCLISGTVDVESPNRTWMCPAMRSVTAGGVAL
jgi:hypothetical protein